MCEPGRRSCARVRRNCRVDVDNLGVSVQAERGQVRGREGSVEHVEVFRMASVTTSILGGLDPYPPIAAHPPTTPSDAKSRHSQAAVRRAGSHGSTDERGLNNQLRQVPGKNLAAASLHGPERLGGRPCWHAASSPLSLGVEQVESRLPVVTLVIRLGPPRSAQFAFVVGRAYSQTVAAPTLSGNPLTLIMPVKEWSGRSTLARSTGPTCVMYDT